VAAPHYTLVVPTYNRPEELGRLLRFLASQRAEFPVLVLDSSRPENHERNLRTARDLKLDLRLERFDPAMPPWEKFRRGAEMVATEFSSLCADDDLVLVSSLGKIVDFLQGNPDYSLAHGWYFEFYLSDVLGIRQVVYRGPSLDAERPADRLHQLFGKYQALTYGVHRTGVLRDIMREVQGVQTMLGRELLGGALAVVAGKVARLPVLYLGRNIGPSEPYADWNPFDFLVQSPQRLFEEYRRYREILIRYGGLDAAEADFVDLAHLRYLADYFKPAVIDYVYGQLRLGRPRQEIMGGIWPVLLDKRGLEGALHRNRFLRRIRDRFVPWLRGYHVRRFIQPGLYRAVSGVVASGEKRTYHVHKQFETHLAEGGLDVRAEDLIDVLAGYA
jgi:glycosyltransferase domain-containing protein